MNAKTVDLSLTLLSLFPHQKFDPRRAHPKAEDENTDTELLIFRIACNPRGLNHWRNVRNPCDIRSVGSRGCSSSPWRTAEWTCPDSQIAVDHRRPDPFCPTLTACCIKPDSRLLQMGLVLSEKTRVRRIDTEPRAIRLF